MHRLRACGFQMIVAVSLAVAGARPAGAQVGTWDFAGEARAVATYEGQTLRLDYPFTGVFVLDADGTYRSAGFAVSCASVPVEVPVLTGTWHVGADGILRGPFSARAVRAALRACLGRGATLLGASGRVRFVDADHLAGRFRFRIRLRYRDGDEIEVVHSRVRGTLAGTRRPE